MKCGGLQFGAKSLVTERDDSAAQFALPFEETKSIWRMAITSAWFLHRRARQEVDSLLTKRGEISINCYEMGV